MSTIMHQTDLQSAVSVSVLKLAMNSEIQEKAEMISNIAVDTSKGMNVDRIV